LNNNIFELNCQPFSSNHQPKEVTRVLKALSRTPGINESFAPSNEIDGLQPTMLWAAKDPKKVESCPLYVPEELQNYTPPRPFNFKPKESPEERFPQLAEEMRKGHIQNETLFAAARAHLNRQPIIMYTEDDGGVSYFPGAVRGDPSYSARMSRRIQEASEKLAEVPGTAFFVTITYSIKMLSKDIFNANRLHNDIVNKFLRRCRLYGECYYVCVLEQTERGYPHVHILLKWKDRFFRTRESLRGEIVLEDWKQFVQFRSWQPFQQFKMLIVSDYAVKNYLTKYVTKGIVIPKAGLESLDEKQLSEFRKATLCYLIGYMVHGRQFRVSNNLAQKKQAAPPPTVTIDAETLETLETFGPVTKELEDALITLLNNLTSVCRAHAWVIFNNNQKAMFSGRLGYYANPTKEEIAAFKRVAYPLGCPGCVVTRFLDNIKKTPDFITREINPEQDDVVASVLRELAELDSDATEQVDPETGEVSQGY
jgi:hypothetical protein